MKIAVIGLGEVGRCYAKALQAAGYELCLCDVHPLALAADLATGGNLPIHTAPGAWLSACDWILSCVTGAQAASIVDQSLVHARPGATFCDMTTASPDVKRASAKRAGDYSVRYIDVAIMGAISLNLEKTPLLASGDGASEFAELITKANGKVRVIDGGVAGEAIALKILRSVFTKGMEALSVELLMAAEKQGVREKLYEQLRDIDDTPLRSFIDMLVRTHVVHARRRVHEVHDAAAELAKHDMPSAVLPGVERRFELTIEALDRRAPTQPEPNIDEALAWLLEHAAQA
jgi:3-hydroxyisobutyrate dehydrogenase